MPDIDIDDLDTDQAKEISDCLFHCINWFRELISAFVTQKNKDIRLKVIKRLNVRTIINFKMLIRFILFIYRTYWKWKVHYLSVC